MERVDVVVVGAGQAGLAVSYLLTRRGIPHVVFERGQMAESWRSQRWDSFTLNTPSWANLLPGCELGDDDDPDAFETRAQLIDRLEAYARTFDPPVREHTAVTAVERQADGSFLVETSSGVAIARHVVVCSGAMSQPKVPMAAGEAPGIATHTAASYRSPDLLPAGAVVVVGSGQSGCQITEDLLQAGRKVYLCASRVARCPRRYRGRDALEWFRDVGLFEQHRSQLEDPEAMYATQPQVSGTDGGHTISLQSLARDGAVLLGRAVEIEGSTLRLVPDLITSIEFADEQAAFLKGAIDQYIAAAGIDAPPAEPDPNEPPLPPLHGSDAMTELDLRAAGVSTIIWCTGFRGDFSWIRHDILDDRNHPRHTDGVSDDVPGLYFVGFPWLSKRKSGLLYGIAEDAERIVHAIAGG